MLPILSPTEGIQVKPAWFKIRPPKVEIYQHVRETLRERNLVTVCEEAHCPNMSECWSGGTATFMVMGGICTRGCKFCAIGTGKEGEALDLDEPKKLSEAIGILKLKYAVITSVDRDDLPDGGAAHFAECIRQVKADHPELLVEVLIPDFQGKIEDLEKVVDAAPTVIAHNVETIARLQKKVRDLRANYKQSFSVLRNIKKLNPKTYSKTALMLGLGETEEEVIACMKELRAADVDILTLGQYLKPKNKYLKVEEYVTPEQFDRLKKIGEEMGFLYVAAGPFIRSSYRAADLFLANIQRKNV